MARLGLYQIYWTRGISGVAYNIVQHTISVAKIIYIVRKSNNLLGIQVGNIDSSSVEFAIGSSLNLSDGQNFSLHLRTSANPLSLEIRLKQLKKQLHRKKHKSLSTSSIIFHICNSNPHLQNFRWLNFVNFTHHGSETGCAWSVISSIAVKNYEGRYRAIRLFQDFSCPPQNFNEFVQSAQSCFLTTCGLQIAHWFKPWNPNHTTVPTLSLSHMYVGAEETESRRLKSHCKLFERQSSSSGMHIQHDRAFLSVVFTLFLSLWKNYTSSTGSNILKIQSPPSSCSCPCLCQNTPHTFPQRYNAPTYKTDSNGFISFVV